MIGGRISARGAHAVVASVAALLCALAAGPSSSYADVEPNNGVAEAEGPLSGGATYPGVIDNANDTDTYLFYVSGEVALDVHVTDTGGPSDCVDATLGNRDNEELVSRGVEYQEAFDFTYTTPPGVNRFYMEFGSCPFEKPGSYSFSISPVGAIVGGASTVKQSAVPGLHEDREQAFGPLTANTAYVDTLQTSNDQNWLTFFTPPQAEPVDLELTLLDAAKCGPVDAVADGSQTVSLQEDRWTHYSFTSGGAAQHFISVGGDPLGDCVGLSWEVIVKAASLVQGLPAASPPPPPPTFHASSPSRACRRDRASLRNAQRLVRWYERRLKAHGLSKAKRRHYRRGLTIAARRARTYAALRRHQCPHGR